MKILSEEIEKILSQRHPELFEVQYGSSTYEEIQNAYNQHCIVYCHVPYNTGHRMAFLAYVGASNFEFQYYRSVASKNANNQGDEVYIYTIDNKNKWTTTTRNAYMKIVPTNGILSSYASGVMTLSSRVATSADMGIVKPDNSTIVVNNGVLSATGGGGSGGGTTGYTVYVTVFDPAINNFNDNPYHYSVNGQAFPSSLLDARSTLPGSFILTNVSTIKIMRDHDENSITVNGVNASFNTDITITGPTYIKVNRQSCLSPDTLILMGNGLSKPLTSVHSGDVVETPFGQDVVTEVSFGTGDHRNIWKFSDGSEVITVGRHRFYNCDLDETLYLEAWNIGEHAVLSDGTKVSLVSHEREDGTFEHGTLFTRQYNLYYANGLLAGNRKSVDFSINQKDLPCHNL